jgi:hypothetical protein
MTLPRILVTSRRKRSDDIESSDTLPLGGAPAGGGKRMERDDMSDR